MLQDFEDWDDVGLNIPKPAELLHLYRDYMRQTGHLKPPCADAECQTENIPEDDVVDTGDEGVGTLDKTAIEKLVRIIENMHLCVTIHAIILIKFYIF